MRVVRRQSKRGNGHKLEWRLVCFVRKETKILPAAFSSAPIHSFFFFFFFDNNLFCVL
jgi:hypothetical protein